MTFRIKRRVPLTERTMIMIVSAGVMGRTKMRMRMTVGILAKGVLVEEVFYRPCSAE